MGSALFIPCNFDLASSIVNELWEPFYLLTEGLKFLGFYYVYSLQKYHLCLGLLSEFKKLGVCYI